MRWRRRADPLLGEVELLAVDLETTGLDPDRHEILSVGMVPVVRLTIELGGARQYAVRPVGPTGVGASATVHGITDDAAAEAAPLAEVLPEVLAALDGRLLLAHHTPIEVGFLRAACRVHGLTWPDVTAVDTVRLQRRVLRRASSPGHLTDAELSLAAARRSLGLPRYRSHEALTDALACAELFLAQVAALSGDRELTLRGVVR